jgi:uncharacterized repeat protein (TIGR02543 family)
MKRTRSFFLAASLSLIGVGAQAQAPVNIFAGDSLPTKQGWSEWKLDTSVNRFSAPVTQEAANSALRFTSVNGVDTFSQLGWYKTKLGLDVTKGYTIELKAKLNVAQKGSFNIQGYDNSGKGFRVNIAPTFLTNQSSPLDSTSTIVSNLTGDVDFHVYRFAVGGSGGATATVYRDGSEIGTFTLSTFQFDNIVENGGFEDEEFPDFLSNGILQRTNDVNNKKVYSGKYALEMNNNKKVTLIDAAYTGMDDIEAARTRPLAIKPNTDYEISITRRRTKEEPWAWRDMGAFYNDQKGVYTGVDDRTSIFFGSVNDAPWLTHIHNFTTPNDKQSVRFEFPSWVRDNDKDTAIASFDNFIFRERPTFVKGTPSGISGPLFHEEYTNLIQNGDFEDHEVNNDGARYTWVLSNVDNENTPTGWNEQWSANVRIQKNDKPDDELGGQWAHSGKSSLRFSTVGNRDKNIDFKKELEPNKIYRFSFWHRSPKWPDQGWLKVKVGDNAIWGHQLIGKNNVWANADLVFTTTEENKTLHLYTEDHGDWFNVYLDDLVLYEVTGAVDPQIADKTNLIVNGDFEDATKDNSGNSYEWALADSSADPADDNYPVAWSEQWGAYVRLQDVKKGIDGNEDTGLAWAHSGTKSLRVSFLNDINKAREFEKISVEDYPDSTPNAFRQNINFEKVLEPHKTYTFVFWLKAANYPDRGTLNVANGNIALWKEELSTKYISWTRHSITFSTTGTDYTLRMYTEFTSWFNFYLDDLFLYEEAQHVPYENSYFFFGKSQNTASADVEVEYVKLLTPGAYAPGEEKLITIAYHLNGGADVFDGEYVINQALTLPIPTKKGYSFAGWYDNNVFANNSITEIPAGTTVKKEFWAKWAIETYTATYHTNGGTTLADTPYTVESDAIVLPTTSEKNGYSFAGWYDNSDLTGEAITEIPQGSYVSKEFWAKWAIETYTVTYHIEGINVSDTSYTIIESITLPTQEGYTITWYNSSDLTGEAVAEIPLGSYGNKEFWARVVPTEYTITYNVNGGDDISQGSYNIASAPVTLPIPQKDNNDFKGWYTNSMFTGDAVTEIPTGSTGNKNFWAKWEPSAGPTAVNTVELSTLRLYPNPVATGILTIESPSGSGKIEVYNVSGTLVGVYSVTGAQTAIDISALPAGTYIVKANGKTAKVVKE